MIEIRDKIGDTVLEVACKQLEWCMSEDGKFHTREDFANEIDKLSALMNDSYETGYNDARREYQVSEDEVKKILEKNTKTVVECKPVVEGDKDCFYGSKCTAYHALTCTIGELAKAICSPEPTALTAPPEMAESFEPCPECGGDGYIEQAPRWMDSSKICPTCQGEGIVADPEFGKSTFNALVECPECGGKGWRIPLSRGDRSEDIGKNPYYYTCPTCQGTGHIKLKQNITEDSIKLMEKAERLQYARVKDGAFIGCDMHVCKWKDNGEVFEVHESNGKRKQLIADGYGSKNDYGNGSIFVNEEDLIYTQLEKDRGEI
jgi:ssDNA-binding Zn-finger/Zn-ribbon topoisomerase 1